MEPTSSEGATDYTAHGNKLRFFFKLLNKTEKNRKIDRATYIRFPPTKRSRRVLRYFTAFVAEQHTPLKVVFCQEKSQLAATNP